MKFTLKEIHRSGTHQAGPDVVELNDYDSLHDYTDKAVIQSCNNSDIFPKSRHYCKLKIVKITNPENNRSIWREVTTYGMKNVKKGDIAMPCKSLWELGVRGRETHVVEVKRGHWWPFYWRHPVHATRVSFRLGIYAMALTVFVALLQEIFKN